MNWYGIAREEISVTRLIGLVEQNSVVLNGYEDLIKLLHEIGDAKYVLLGEASHGTHEFYAWRTQISKRLIEQKGFNFIAVEGDWPDCYKLNRYIKSYPESGKIALDVLRGFNRWPTWMWANWEVVALAEWLKQFNKRRDASLKVGFYGLDVYSLWESLDSIINYLNRKDPLTKATADKVLRCFEPYSDEEGRAYARATQKGSISCEDEVIRLLSEIRRNMESYNTDREAVLSAEQNAHVAVNAERYYRAMVRSGSDSWNIRDRHMVDTLGRLMDFHGNQAKAIIWAHNTHIGDARATDMASDRMYNIGQLLNQDYGNEVYAIGFGSFAGTVIAGYEWGDDIRKMPLPPAKEGSWEYVLHQLNAKDRVIYMNEIMKNAIGKSRIRHRAVGVVYHPSYDAIGNYVPSVMPLRYNAFIYLDNTSALHPLHILPDGHQIPETFPFGI